MGKAAAAVLTLLLIAPAQLSAGPVTLEESWSKSAWGSVEALAWSPDGGELAAGTGTGSLFLFSKSGSGLWARGLGSTVTSVTWVGSLIVASTSSGLVRAYTRSGDWTWSLQLPASVSELATGPGTVAAAAGPEAVVLNTSGGLLRRFELNGTVSHVALMGNRSVASVGGEVLLLGENVSRIAGLDSTVTCLSASEGGLLAAGSADGTVAVIREGDVLLLRLASTGIEDLDWGPTDLLAAGSGDGVVRIVTPSGEEVWSGSVGSAVSDVEWAPDGSLLAVGGHGGELLVVTPTGTEVLSKTFGEPVESLAWSPDSSALAVGTWSVGVLVKVSPTISISGVKVSRYGDNVTVDLSVSPSLQEQVAVGVSLLEGGVEVAAAEVTVSGSGGALNIPLGTPLAPGHHVLTLRAGVGGEEVASQVVEVEVLPHPPKSASLSVLSLRSGGLRVRAEFTPAPDPRWPLPAELVVSEAGRTLVEEPWNISSGDAERDVQLELEPGVHELSVELVYDGERIAVTEARIRVYSASLEVNSSTQPGEVALRGEVRLNPPPAPDLAVEAELQVSERGEILTSIPVTLTGEAVPFEAELRLERGTHVLTVTLLVEGSPAASRELAVEVPGSAVGAALKVLLAALAVMGAAALALRLRASRIEGLKVRALEVMLERGGRASPDELASALGISPGLARKVLEALREEGAFEEV